MGEQGFNLLVEAIFYATTKRKEKIDETKSFNLLFEAIFYATKWKIMKRIFIMTSFNLLVEAIFYAT